MGFGISLRWKNWFLLHYTRLNYLLITQMSMRIRPSALFHYELIMKLLVVLDIWYDSSAQGIVTIIITDVQSSKPYIGLYIAQIVRFSNVSQTNSDFHRPLTYVS
jgi:hypothetical protein